MNQDLRDLFDLRLIRKHDLPSELVHFISQAADILAANMLVFVADEDRSNLSHTYYSESLKFVAFALVGVLRDDHGKARLADEMEKLFRQQLLQMNSQIANAAGQQFDGVLVNGIIEDLQRDPFAEYVADDLEPSVRLGEKLARGYFGERSAKESGYVRECKRCLAHIERACSGIIRDFGGR